MAADEQDPTHEPEQAISQVQAALFGCCPRCGSRTLFQGVAKFAHKCSVCGLDFDQFNVGDGPAAFITLIVGAAVVVCALILEVAAHPPFWVHALLWIPLTAAACAYGLRVSKGWLLQAEYWRKAREAGHTDIRPRKP
jgi:uncharacterized protein (DUF983 family)